MLFFPVNPNPPPTCATCGLLDVCGGLPGDDFQKGCFQRCNSYCKEHGCDLVCPSIPLKFAQDFEDVGGICQLPRVALLVPDLKSVPRYVPQINHGGSRTVPLNEPWVLLPLYEIAKMSHKKYSVRFESPDQIRNHFKLSNDTKIIVSGVAFDRYIEDFWSEHVVRDIPKQLARLGINAMTVPNYSFMRDVPRTNSLFNMSRIFRVCETLTEAGIAAIPHLNAMTKMDWQRWESLLKEQSQINSVCVEFQTGGRSKEFGRHYFEALVNLQKSVGRPLHPIAIGGTGRIIDFNNHFASFTVTDATPFLKTMYREVYRRVGLKWKWRHEETSENATLNRRMAENIKTHREVQLRRIGLTSDNQLLLPRAA